jgi:hypothetical protein
VSKRVYADHLKDILLDYGLARMLTIGEHPLCASAENLRTPVRHVALLCPVAESDCACGQMEQPKEQLECTDVVHKLPQSTAPHSLLRTVWALIH